MSRTPAEFQPQRLKQARDAKWMSMSELAARTGVTRQAISQYENGSCEPATESLGRIAGELGLPRQYFFKRAGEISAYKETPSSFRSMARSASKSRRQAEVYFSWMASILDTYVAFIDLPPVNLPAFDACDFDYFTEDDIEELAEKTRTAMGLGVGPISDLTLLLENHGVIVAQAPLHADLDGLSSWFAGRPLVLLCSHTNAFRRRFDLAHELGHLIMHRTLSEEDLEDRERFNQIERQAYRFAGAFLVPQVAIESEVYRVDFESLMELKKRWKMSVAAIIVRLAQVGSITDQKKRRLFQMLNQRNARRHEPLDSEYTPEAPVLFRKAYDFLVNNGVWDGTELRTKTGLPDDFISTITGVPAEALWGQEVPDNVVFLRRSDSN